MNLLRSKFFALLLGVMMFSAVSTPARVAKSKHRQKHAKHVAAAHHRPKHKPAKHA